MTPVGSTLSPATSRATPQMANSPVRANGALEQPLKDVASPAVVNDVRSARNRFSYRDQVTTDTALMPFVRSLPEFSRAGAVEKIYQDAAAIRSRGEDAVVVSMTMPEGEATARVYSRGEFLTAVNSHDPDSLGSFETKDGKKHFIRDYVRKSLVETYGVEMPVLERKDRIAAMIVGMFDTQPDATEKSPGDAQIDKMKQLRTLSLQAADSPTDNVNTLTLISIPSGPAAKPVGATTTEVDI